MKNYFSPHLVLLVLATLTLISIPIIWMVFPIFYVQTFIYDSLTIVLYPDGLSNRIVMGSCIVLLLGFVIPLIKQNKFTYSLLVVFMAGSIFGFYLSTLGYTYVGKEEVVLSKLFDKTTFKWTEINSVVLEYYTDDMGTHEEYTFTSLNGVTIQIPLTDQFLPEDKDKIYRIAKENNVEFIEREKKEVVE